MFAFRLLGMLLNLSSRQIAETASLMRRTPLLLLHAFCLRLQDEDTAFIREFIQRHVEFRHKLKTPNLFQPMTPSDRDAVSLPLAYLIPPLSTPFPFLQFNFSGVEMTWLVLSCLLSDLLTTTLVQLADPTSEEH
jgi:hypothetical protein